jgi:triphosphoribosyl-dephospho-CoA synthase
MDPEPKKQIAQLVQMACALEVCAPKPGNVNRYNDFPDASLQDYVLSAIAIGPAFQNSGQVGVGQMVLDAVRRTRARVSTNTNLGMILLLAPLAKACDCVESAADVRAELKSVLHSLTVEDARLAYEAIRLAQPGGLGHAPQADVAGTPSITLTQSMALAMDWDAIAREYVTDFTITFEIGLPAVRKAHAQGADSAGAIVHAFLTILSAIPDTLIARKNGKLKAQDVSRAAADVLAKGGIFTPEGREAVAALDSQLRNSVHPLNPGTTADLTAAATFLALFEEL